MDSTAYRGRKVLGRCVTWILGRSARSLLAERGELSREHKKQPLDASPEPFSRSC